MEFFYSVMIIEFVLQAVFLWILLSIFAKKEADVVWLKLMFAAMAISLLTFMIHMGFSDFLGPGVLVIDFLFITLVIQKFFDVRFLRSAMVTVCFMFGAMFVQLGINQFAAKQETISEEIAEAEATRNEITAETFKEMQKTLAGPEHAAAIEEHFAKLEEEHKKKQEETVTGASSLGAEMIKLKDLVLLTIKGGEEATEETHSEADRAEDPTEESTGEILTGHAPAPAPAPDGVDPDDFEAMFPVFEPAATPVDDGLTQVFVDNEGADQLGTDEESDDRTIKVALPRNVKTSPYEIHSSNMSKLVHIRNQSNNSAYPAPPISVSATGMGKGGNYVIADGRFIGHGQMLRVPTATPQFWRLVKASSTIVVWEPVFQEPDEDLPK